MGASIWEQLTTSFNFSDVVFILLLFAAFILAVTKGWQELLKVLGLESTEKRLYEETIKALENKIIAAENKIIAAENKITALEESAKKFNDDRVRDREQSRGYQHEYMEIVNGIYRKQDDILDKVDALAEQSRKYQLADMRETLLQAYRYYTNENTNGMLAWTEIECHAWNEQYDVYKQNGGNSHLQNTVKPEMDRLRVISLDDYEGMAELMASRSRCN